MAKYIELNAFVKLMNLATTGGQAKLLIRSGDVMLNGQAETRNRKKLSAGDKVEYQGKVYLVKEEMLQMGSD
jgi:ribosome-associated protein